MKIPHLNVLLDVYAQYETDAGSPDYAGLVAQIYYEGLMLFE